MTATSINFIDRFKLEPYRGKKTRTSCPSCGAQHQFARFIDITTGEYVGDYTIGRCNRTEKCGYYKAPTAADVKGDLVVSTNKILPKYREPDVYTYMDSRVVMKTRMGHRNNLQSFLENKFGIEVVTKILDRYQVGSLHYWNEPATVFWQIDVDFNVRTGKIMLYDDNGKRVKKPWDRVAWMHTPYSTEKEGGYPDFYLRQCFFGEHLLNYNPKEVNVVESEKTAIICSIHKPNTFWVATGGMQNINEDRLRPFEGCKLVFYPDKGKAYKDWQEKLKKIDLELDYKVSDFLETKETVADGEDIADYLLTLKTKK